MGGLGRIWASSCSQNRLQEPRGRHRLSTVIQPLRQTAGEVVDLTVDEDGNNKSRRVLFDGRNVLITISYQKRAGHTLIFSVMPPQSCKMK